MVKNASSTTHGVKEVIFGLVDDDGQLIKGENGLSENGLYAPTANYEGVTQANITGIETNGTAQFANNKKKRTTHGAQSPQVALNFLDIGWTQMNKLIGYVADPNDGGWSYQDPKPHVAMLLVSEGLDGSTVYEGFAKGTAIDPQRNHQTDNTAEVDADAALTYEAEEPDADVFKTTNGNKTPYRKWNSEDPSFKGLDKVFGQVFPGFDGTASLDVNNISSTTPSKPVSNS